MAAAAAAAAGTAAAAAAAAATRGAGAHWVVGREEGAESERERERERERLHGRCPILSESVGPSESVVLSESASAAGRIRVGKYPSSARTSDSLSSESGFAGHVHPSRLVSHSQDAILCHARTHTHTHTHTHTRTTLHQPGASAPIFPTHPASSHRSSLASAHQTRYVRRRGETPLVQCHRRKATVSRSQFHGRRFTATVSPRR